MGLSSDLVSQFVKETNDTKKTSTGATYYGTIVLYNKEQYVKIDGSDFLTPISSTVIVEDGDRVLVTLKDHSAIVTGSTSSPSASNKEVIQVGDKITDLEIVVADKVSTGEFDAQVGRIDELVSDNIIVKDTLTANKAEIESLKAHDVVIDGNLDATNAEIENLKVKKLDADIADIKFATIEKLEATNADIQNLNVDYGKFKELTTNKLVANEADIKKLDTEKLSATQADIKYAQIDFANINMAAIEKLFTDSGIIKDLIVSDGHITGELVGVTIKGDLIEGNTIKADKLVVKGSDGLYYKLNVNGETIESQQTDYNSLNGSVITAKSITATKISVDDLVAFDATIAGLNLTNGAIYSGVKSSIDNGTQGFYLDKYGQMSIGDSDNFLKYFKNQNGVWKLAISAGSIILSSSGKDVETSLGDTIVSAVEEFYLSTSPTELLGGNWSNTQPTWVDGTYIWRRTFVEHGNGTTEYTPSENGVCITGNTGPAGPAGKGINSTSITYQASSSGTVAPTGSWSNTIPTVSQGQYLWSKTFITYTDASTSTTYSVSYIPKNGQDGATGPQGPTGATGSTGTGVASITQQYYLSTSKTTQTGGSWITSMPIWSSGKYLWTRYLITYNNPTSTSYTSPVCDSSWEAVNEIQVGGRNLATKTNQGETGWSWSMQTGTYTSEEYVENDIKGVKLTRGTDSQSGWSYISYAYIGRPHYIPDTDYTVSFDLKPSVDTIFEALLLRVDGTDRLTNTSERVNAKKNIWNKMVFTLRTVTPLPSDVEQVLYLQSMVSSPGVSYAFRNLKIEKGNRATDWTPAPEDVQADIEQVRTEYKADLKVERDRITSNVNATNALGTRTSALEQTADGLTSDVSNLTNELTNAKSSIDQNADRIEANVQETTYLGSRVSTVEQTANGLSSKVTGLEGEVSTLEQTANGLSVTLNSTIKSTQEQFYSSNSPTTLTGGSWNSSQPTWTNGKYIWRRTLVTYTDNTTSYTPSSTGVCITGNTGATGATGATGPQGPKGDGLDVKDTKNSNYPPLHYINNYPSTSVAEFKYCSTIGLSGVGTFCHLRTDMPYKDTSGGYPRQTAKVEGTGKEYWRVGIDNARWSSWIDPYGQAVEAAKTATNFLGFDANGLMVADKTGTSIGNNVLIGNSDIKIRNGNTILATFGDNLIELGKNDIYSTIDLCNGTGQITSYYDADWDTTGTKLESKAIDIVANDPNEMDTSFASSVLSSSVGSKSESTVTSTATNDSSYVSIETSYSSTNSTRRASIGVVAGPNAYDSSISLDITGANNVNSILITEYDTTFYNPVEVTGGLTRGNIRETFQNKLLWSGTSWPSSSQTCALSELVTNQPHGIVIVFSNYDSSEGAQDQRFNSFFVPKSVVAAKQGKGWSFLFSSNTFGQVAGKYLYISDGKIVGHADNTSTGTGSTGITYKNNLYVLRYVYGV